MIKTELDDRRARYVRTLLVWHGQSPDDLKELLGQARDTVYKKLEGRRAFTTGDLVAIAETLGVDPGLLLRPPLEVAELGVISRSVSACTGTAQVRGHLRLVA